jgi:hypothetical protein
MADAIALSAELRTAAGELAAMVDATEFDDCAAGTEFNMRALSVELLRFADAAQALEEAARPRSARELGNVERFRPALALIASTTPGTPVPLSASWPPDRP